MSNQQDVINAMALMAHLKVEDSTQLSRFELLKRLQTIKHIMATLGPSADVDELQGQKARVQGELESYKQARKHRETDRQITEALAFDVPQFVTATPEEDGVHGGEGAAANASPSSEPGPSGTRDTTAEASTASPEKKKKLEPTVKHIKIALKDLTPRASRVEERAGFTFRLRSHLSLGQDYTAALEGLRRRAPTPHASDALLANAPSTSSHLLEFHESQQNELVSALSGMSTRLKENSLHFAQSLQRDKDVLEKLDSSLSENHTNLTGQSKKLDIVSKKSRATTCMTFSLVFTILVLWIVFFIIIRIT